MELISLAGSYYHSVLADINGDGKKELINHHFDKMGFWSIGVNGPDSYTYPDFNNAEGSKAYAHMQTDDGVAFMGIQRLDVDGDGKDEIGGIIIAGQIRIVHLYYTLITPIVPIIFGTVLR